MVIRSRVWRHKGTGVLATQIPLLDIGNWEEVKHPTEKQYKKAKLTKVM